MASRTIDFRDRAIDLSAVVDPNMSQFNMWLAAMKRDHLEISDREMAAYELAFKRQASQSKIMYNPFTGEIRKVDWSV